LNLLFVNIFNAYRESILGVLLKKSLKFPWKSA